jgi:hypothetical protein
MAVAGQVLQNALLSGVTTSYPERVGVLHDTARKFDAR